jgi:PHD/YefM family antitoxin component YafN of YafNO toxin-antitoxin module
MNLQSYTASDARKQFYTLIKTAASGLAPIEINLLHTDPVVMISKADYESWLETLDIMSSPEEMKAIMAGRKNRKLISHAQMKKKFGI